MGKEAAAVWGQFGDNAGLCTVQCFPQGRAGPEWCRGSVSRGGAGGNAGVAMLVYPFAFCSGSLLVKKPCV